MYMPFFLGKVLSLYLMTIKLLVIAQTIKLTEMEQVNQLVIKL